MKASNHDPGTPSEKSVNSFAALSALMDPAPPTPEPSAPAAPKPPEPKPAMPNPNPDLAPALEGGAIDFRKEVNTGDREFAELSHLVRSGHTQTMTVLTKELEVDLDYLQASVSGGKDTPLLRRFILPRHTSIRMRPSKDLRIEVDGEVHTVTFLGDIHDFDGLFPFKVITFVSNPKEDPAPQA